jgi:hypothetical protein
MPKITIAGHKVEITLDDRCRLAATIEGKTLSAGSLEELTPQIARTIRRAKAEFNIPIVIEHPATKAIVRAVLRGQHASTGHALLTVDGEKFTVERSTIYGRGDDLSDEDIAALEASRAALADAQRHWYEARKAAEAKSKAPLHGFSTYTLLNEQEEG